MPRTPAANLAALGDDALLDLGERLEDERSRLKVQAAALSAELRRVQPELGPIVEMGAGVVLAAAGIAVGAAVFDTALLISLLGIALLLRQPVLPLLDKALDAHVVRLRLHRANGRLAEIETDLVEIGRLLTGRLC